MSNVLPQNLTKFTGYRSARRPALPFCSTSTSWATHCTLGYSRDDILNEDTRGKQGGCASRTAKGSVMRKQ